MASELPRKSRNGCLRCKAKKTKCDEKKPACSRCENRGYQCPGYALNVRWSQKHQVSMQRNVSKEPAAKHSQAPLVGGSDNVIPQRSPKVGVTAPPMDSRDTIQQANQDSHLLDWVPSLSQCGACDLLEGAPQEVPPPSFTAFDLDLGLFLDFDAETGYDFALAGFSCSPLEQYPDADLPGNPQCPTQENQNERTTPSTAGLLLGPCNPTDLSDLLADTPLSPSRPQEPFDVSSALVTYFFKEVIPLYCTWDNSSNLLRILLQDMWQSSGALYHTLQSMAAVALSSNFSSLAAAARGHHIRALQYLQGGPVSSICDNAKPLAFFLLGHTSSWFDPNDLATNRFNEARKSANSLTSLATNSLAKVFLDEALDYWAMLLAFLTDDTGMEVMNHPTSIDPTRPVEGMKTNVPHPWNGISREVVKMLTDTGRLIFRVKKHLSTATFTHDRDMGVFDDALQEAHLIEKRLLSFRVADSPYIQDTGDPKSPLKHFSLMDDAFRYTGLLQLYRIFPDLLSIKHQSFDKENKICPQVISQLSTRRERNEWLTNLAMNILGILQQVPFDSGTQCIQPFILVAVSSELRCDTPNTVNSRSINIARSRNFIRSRLSAFTHILPLRKSDQQYQLVNCIWAAIDSGDQDVYWMDVAFRMRLSTIMG